MWAGPNIRFPLNIENLLEDIGFANDTAYCLINGESILAFGQLLSKKNGFLHLARIIVDPSHRESGYGKILCNELLQIARQMGYQKISLNVYRANLIALKLYTNLGFNEVAEKSSVENCFMIKS